MNLSKERVRILAHRAVEKLKTIVLQEQIEQPDENFTFDFRPDAVQFER